MKKMAVYFTDRQWNVLEADAAQAGVTFAEMLRRSLDAWMNHREGAKMAEETQAAGAEVLWAYVKLNDEDSPRAWRNATIEEDEYNHIIEVWRERRKVASFACRDVSSWYVDEPDEA